MNKAFEAEGANSGGGRGRASASPDKDDARLSAFESALLAAFESCNLNAEGALKTLGVCGVEARVNSGAGYLVTLALKTPLVTKALILPGPAAVTVEEFEHPLVTLLFPNNDATLSLEVTATLGSTKGIDIRDLNLIEFHWD